MPGISEVGTGRCIHVDHSLRSRPFHMDFQASSALSVVHKTEKRMAKEHEYRMTRRSVCHLITTTSPIEKPSLYDVKERGALQPSLPCVTRPHSISGAEAGRELKVQFF